jgi:hypothetical protein
MGMVRRLGREPLAERGMIEKIFHDHVNLASY